MTRPSLGDWQRHLVREAVLWREGAWPTRLRAELLRYEQASAENQRAHSLNLLRHALFVAYHTVPYYKRRFDEAGLVPTEVRAFDDLAKIPPLEKTDIQGAGEQLHGTGPDRVGALPDATGGSTGVPIAFLRSRRMREIVAANESRTWRWYGVPDGARLAQIWGADRDVSPEAHAASWKSRAIGVRGLNAFRLDEGRCATYAEILRDFRPPMIYGYATALARFAAHLEERDRPLGYTPAAIRSTAEVLLPEHRTRIERAFGAPVYDYYGSRDAGPIAGECREHQGLHVFSDVTWVEVLRSDGTACAKGEVGDVVITTLHEHAMPFVRYHTGDRAAWMQDAPCPCGIALPRLSSVAGRRGDFIVTPSGEEIHSEFFTHLFYGKPRVRRFQVEQTARDELVLRIEGEPRVEDVEQIRAAATARFAGAVRVERTDHIIPSATGKHRFVLPFRTA